MMKIQSSQLNKYQTQQPYTICKRQFNRKIALIIEFSKNFLIHATLLIYDESDKISCGFKAFLKIQSCHTNHNQQFQNGNLVILINTNLVKVEQVYKEIKEELTTFQEKNIAKKLIKCNEDQLGLNETPLQISKDDIELKQQFHTKETNSAIHKIMKTEQNINDEQDQGIKRIDVSFEEVCYRVEAADESGEKYSKTILHGVSGVFKGGQLSVIMGASGAGKTTLLNVLAGRVTASEGAVCANGLPYDFHSFGGFGNYVMQGDILMETLTVRETLEFAASLKLRDKAMVRKRVEEMIGQMKLDSCACVLIGGNLTKGVSGGEKKRTGIAVELLSDPQVVALDEPTSGLDSLTSFIIVNELKTLARSGKTIFLTIHQPNNEIYALFDTLFLMAEGRMVYQGAASASLDYFADNFGLVCPEFQNPAEFYMSILHHDDPRNTARYEQYFEAYQKQSKVQIANRIKAVEKTPIVPRVSEASFFYNVGILLNRDVKNMIRNPLVMQSRIFQINFLAIFTAGLYFNAGRQEYTDTIKWHAITGYLFFVAMDLFMQAMLPATVTFPSQRLVFLKQENSKMYTLNQYFLSRNIIQIPYILLIPFLFLLISYWMVGLANTAEQFFTMYIIILLMSFTATSAGMFAGSIITDPRSFANIVTFVTTPLLAFSGFFKNYNSMAKWIGWVRFLSPFNYSFTALVGNETKYKPGLIDQLNFEMSTWIAILILFCLGVGLRVLSYMLLAFKKEKLQ